MPTILDHLIEHFPLKHREVHVVVSQKERTHVWVCFEGHIHYSHQFTASFAVQLTGLVFAYTIALSLDSGDELTRENVDRVVATLHEALVEINDDFANGFLRNFAEIEASLFDGEIGGPANVDEATGWPTMPDEVIDSALDKQAMLRAVFGYTLENGPGCLKPKGEN